MLHAWLDGLLPTAPATVFDLGVGIGRDAAWFASNGYDVLGVEACERDALGGRTLALEPAYPLDQ